jgi:hypothetical protein
VSNPFRSESDDSSQEKLIPERLNSSDKPLPASKPVYPIDDKNTIELELDEIRTSGMGSYMQQRIIGEGPDFDPEHPDVIGKYTVKETGAYKVRPHRTVEVPVGTLCYKAGGSNSGYNVVIFYRAGVQGSETEPLRIPIGSRPEDLFSHFPKGSYIALPGESYIPHPEYRPPWKKEFSITARDRGDYFVPLDLTSNRFDWTELEHHPNADLVKERSRHKSPEGTLTLTANDPSSQIALIEYEFEKWRLETWDGKPLTKEEALAIARRVKGDPDLQLPEYPKRVKAIMERENPYAEFLCPFEGKGKIAYFIFRTEKGRYFLVQSATMDYEPEGSALKKTSEEFTQKISNFIQPATGFCSGGNSGVSRYHSTWYEIDTESSQDVKLTYWGQQVTLKDLKDVANAAGLYAVWFNNDSFNSDPTMKIHPTSFTSRGTTYVAATPWEALKSISSVMDDKSLGRRPKAYVDDLYNNLCEQARKNVKDALGRGVHWYTE